jgi:hypothetical protein
LFVLSQHISLVEVEKTSFPPGRDPLANTNLFVPVNVPKSNPSQYPLKRVEVTDVKPASVVLVAPRSIEVLPIVILSLDNFEFGIVPLRLAIVRFVRRLPSPEKLGQVNKSVEGLNLL